LESVTPINSEVREDTPSRAPTGVFFHESTVDALCEAVLLCRRCQTAFDPEAIRRNALRFDRPGFKARITTFLAGKMGVAIA
jgi:hypothetical protein